MIEQMKIGVSFVMKTDNTKLNNFLKNIAKAEKSVGLLNTHLVRTAELLTKMDAALNLLNPKVKDFTTGFSALAVETKKSSGAFTSLNRKLLTSATRMDNTRSAARHLTNALVDLEAVGGAAGLSLGSGAKNTGQTRTAPRAHKGMHGLLGLSGLGTIAGVSPATAGLIGVGYLGVKGFQANAQFQQAAAQFAAQGFGPQANAAASNFAKNTRLPGISSVEMMQAVNDAATVTRNAAQALKLAPTIAEMSFSNKTLFNMQGKSFTHQDEMRLLRFAELKTGSTDPNKLIPTLNLLEKGFTSDAARLSANDLFTFGKLGAAMISQLSDTGLAALFPLIQSLGGARAGTGIYTMQTSLMKGQNMRTGKRAVHELERLGIYNSQGKLKKGFGDLLQSDPVGFINSVLLPAMTKAGFVTDKQQIAEANVIFTQTAARIVAQVKEQNPRIAASRALVPQAAGVSTAFQSALNTPKGQTAQVAAAWSRLITDIGTLTGPTTSRLLDNLTMGLDFLDHVVRFIDKASDLLNSLPAPLSDQNLGTMINKGGSAVSSIFHKAEDDVKNFTSSHSGGTHTTVLNVDGRALAQTLYPHFIRDLYLGNVSDQSRFNGLRSATVSSNTNYS